MEDKIVNIVICYNNEDEVINYAIELSKQTINVQLVVVINKIGEKGIQYIADKLSMLNLKFEIYDSKKNRGYLNGLLFGYKYTKFESNWYVLSNTDIKIKDKRFFEKFMESETSTNKKYWLIGPSVYVPAQKKYFNPYFLSRPNKLFYYSRIFAMKFPKMFHLVYRLKNIILKKNNSFKVQSCDAYAVHGSYMFLRKELLDILIKQEPWELLYDEEQYIAEIVRQFGKKVFYNSLLEVVHLEGMSTGKMSQKDKYKFMMGANKRILKEFY